jgi:tetratricopeptide (TPR) repeat protein
LVLLPAIGVAEEGPSLDKEISFGVKMAKRGLWSEALFRFKRAAEQRPGDSKVLNNLAVAYEAVGQYDNALLAYREALKADSNNRELKRNYSRFIEFYQAFKPAGEEPEGEQLEAQQDSGESTEPPSSPSGQ